MSPRGKETQPIVDAVVVEDDETIAWEPQDVADDDGVAVESETGKMVPFEFISQLATQDQIEEAFARSLARVDVNKRLKAAMLSMTNHFDWVAFAAEGDPDGKPYLQGCGCDKIMHAFGIEMENDGGKREPNPDGGYEYVYRGRVRARVFSDIWYDVVGSRWSGDGFFGSRPDPGDVRKAGHTNFMNRAIKTALGIRSITWEELEMQPGLEDLRKKAAKVGFRGSGPKGAAPAQPGEIHEIAQGPHYDLKIDYNTGGPIREAVKKAIRPAERNYTGKDGEPKYMWQVKHTIENCKRILDIKAEHPAMHVTPVNVPPDEMP